MISPKNVNTDRQDIFSGDHAGRDGVVVLCTVQYLQGRVRTRQNSSISTEARTFNMVLPWAAV